MIIAIKDMVPISLERISPTATKQNKTKINNQQVFECLTNTIPQNTTTNNHQTQNTVQDLKFRVYLLVV